MSESNIKIEMSCKLPEEWEQHVKERADATPEAEKGKSFVCIDYDPTPSNWLSRDWSHMLDMSKAIALVPDGKGGFDKYPRLFKKGDIVYFIEEDCAARIAGAKPYPLIVITDQKPSHINVQCRDFDDRDNELADQFLNPNNLRYANTQRTRSGS